MTEFKKTDGSEFVAYRPPTPDQVVKYTDTPLQQLPAEWRVPVWDFWCFWQHLLPTQVALVTRLRQWRQTEGITLEEVQYAFAKINATSQSHLHKFAGELLSDLAIHLTPGTNPLVRERRFATEPEWKVMYRNHDAEVAAWRRKMS